MHVCKIRLLLKHILRHLELSILLLWIALRLVSLLWLLLVLLLRLRILLLWLLIGLLLLVLLLRLLPLRLTRCRLLVVGRRLSRFDPAGLAERASAAAGLSWLNPSGLSKLSLIGGLLSGLSWFDPVGLPDRSAASA